MKQNPNVVMIMVDQMRYDCLGVHGNKIISTPNLDQMATEGYDFNKAYSAVPTCVPARVELLTGLSQAHSGRVGYRDGVPFNYEQTLPRTFSQLGYQTECIGKMHVHPKRDRVGFEHVLLHDGYLHHSRNSENSFQTEFERSDDYLYWLKQNKGIDTDLIDSGLDCNSWVARPFPYEEKYHPTNWLVNQSIDFLRCRDSTKPFFLKMSFTHPHAPLDPPEYYFNMYMDLFKDKNSLYTMGNWEETLVGGKTHNTTDIIGELSALDLKRMIAAYYGSITHIDHQIGRFLMALGEANELKNTIILFVSDHGDQLGEHHLLRKAYPYEGSIHIPFLIYDPGKNILAEGNKQVNEIVALRDIYPSLVELATGEHVEGIDGVSVKDCLLNNTTTREYLHGEHSFGELSSQFIVTKNWKLIWYPVKNIYQLFNLETDPDERENLYFNQNCNEVIRKLKNYLLIELSNREEKFVIENELTKVPLERITPVLEKTN